jgi:hypothetical protein
MHFLSVIVLVASASAAAATSFQRVSTPALAGMVKRQDICVPVPEPVTCEKSCGPGNIQCVNPLNCYNPSAGESCCSNGSQYTFSWSWSIDRLDVANSDDQNTALLGNDAPTQAAVLMSCRSPTAAPLPP